MRYEVERELILLISDAYVQGLEKKYGAVEALMERFHDIMEMNKE